MQSSVVEDQEKLLDQSLKVTMEDSTAMTIDILRAQLLSERSISRNAKQQAEELAKRVVELEEQLKFVALQRMKAEKATTEVLAILESNGISDFSEVCDSSSEQEGVGNESREVGDVTKEEVSLTTSRSMRIEVEELSALELGVPPLITRSLSWKSCSESPSALENVILLDGRRCRSFASSGGLSTRHHLAKSCRQIKQKEKRSSEAVINDGSLLDAQEHAVATRPGDVSHDNTEDPKAMKEYRKIGGKMYYRHVGQGLQEDHRKEAGSEVVFDGSERNVEMEKALKHQASLMGQFEAEENAQRKWEEKFKGNSCYSLDSYERGDHSDVTEERDEIRAETTEAVNTIPSLGQGRKPGMEQVYSNGEAMTKDVPNGFTPQIYHENGFSQKQQCISSTADQTQNTSEFSFPGQVSLEAKSNEKRKQEWSESNSFRSASYVSSEKQAAQFSSFHASSEFYKGQSSVNSTQVSAHHETPNGLGGVLDALQKAKLSLNRLASSTGDGRVVRTTDPPVSAVTAGSAIEAPLGYAGLFRVPTSSELQAPATPNSSTRYPESEANMAKYYTGLRAGPGSDDRYTSSPTSSLHSSTHSRLIDPYMDKGIGLPSSSRFMYPSYIDLMPRMSSNDVFSSKYPSMGLGMAAEDRYLEYSDQIRADMYKR